VLQQHKRSVRGHSIPCKVQKCCIMTIFNGSSVAWVALCPDKRSPAISSSVQRTGSPSVPRRGRSKRQIRGGSANTKRGRRRCPAAWRPIRARHAILLRGMTAQNDALSVSLRIVIARQIAPNQNTHHGPRIIPTSTAARQPRRPCPRPPTQPRSIAATSQIKSV